MYTQAGDPLPFSSVHSDKDHDEDYGDYTEPDPRPGRYTLNFPKR